MVTETLLNNGDKLHQPQLVDAGILNHQQLLVRKQKQLGDLCMGHEMGPILEIKLDANVW